MADAILEIVVDNLITFVEGRLATFWGVDSQIQKLTSNLTAIRAVLQDAEEKQFTSHAVKDWLHKLSDAAYVLDDILDECSIQGGVSEAQSTCLTRFNPKTILFRCDVGNRMKAIAQRFHDIDEERRMFQLHEGVVRRQAEDDEWRQTSSAIIEQQIYGRDQDKEKIVEFLLSHPTEELSIYPIVGMGGLGKTTLARWVFNHDRVTQHFDLLIWVCVSDDFSLMRILQSIVESITGQNPNLTSLESMQKKVQELLLGRRYLLVLDDVWNEDKEEWDKLKGVLLCRGATTQGASILVSTRNESVAAIVGTCPSHHLFPLSEDDNWALFKHHAFGQNKEERAELVAIGKEIVRKCRGSPLAAKALGSLLRNKREARQWLIIKESRLWDIPEVDGIMRALRISYFGLKLSLRRCFSFCAIFPQDYLIAKETLIHLWMANGLVRSRGNLEVEDVGCEAWNELNRRSFFQEVETDSFGNTTFKIHDLFHELAQSIMGEECKVSMSSRMTNLSSRVHHVSLLDYLHPPLKLNMGAFKKAESLRSLIEFYSSARSLGELPPSIPLRALRTSSSQLSSLKNLTHLRYLNVCDSDITTLPECVSGLRKLQTLKLEFCWHLSCLPTHLTQLKDLRHIQIEECRSLRAMPKNMGELKCLKTLSVFIVDSMEGYGLDELHDLKLGGKLTIEGLENVRSESDATSANLISKRDLHSLHLLWGRNDANLANIESEGILEALEPHSSLKSFGLYGYKGTKFPSWMKNTWKLSCLVNVTLYRCQNCEELPPLGKLPLLTKLTICYMKNVKYIDDDSYDGVEKKAFKSLKELTLRELPKLERMVRDQSVEIEMLPLLSKLTISSVPMFQLPNLPSIEDASIRGLVWDSNQDGNVDMDSYLQAILKNINHAKTLHIEFFSKMRELPHELGNLCSLQELAIGNCGELESLSGNVLQGLTSLQSLRISSCKNLKSLSEGLGHLTCLTRLHIWSCPKLMILGNLNMLTSLVEVGVNCLSGKIPEGLQHIPSLQSLTLCYAESLPEWLGDMASLQQLSIQCCEELCSLPSSFRKLTNLQKLSISHCPKLEKRCRRGTGEDWPFIAHIPHFKFNLDPWQEKTCCDRIRYTWNTRKNRSGRLTWFPS